jgi:hypothetical protein
MLFKQVHLKGIYNGEISLAFRKWQKPLIKRGSIIKTSIGQVEILEIIEINASEITLEEAERAGYKDLESLLESLDRRPNGNIYKIQVRYHLPDPRISLREQSNLSDEDVNNIRTRLQRMDERSKYGKWTMPVLFLIKENPKMRAQFFADKMNVEKNWLKSNIRKLKNMGLTMSHEIGYTLSPRGESYFQIILN